MQGGSIWTTCNAIWSVWFCGESDCSRLIVVVILKDFIQSSYFDKKEFIKQTKINLLVLLQKDHLLFGQMDQEKRDKFTGLWEKYFNNAELPIAFQYTDNNQDIPVSEAPQGHRCLIAQLLKVRHGGAICLQPHSVPCIGGKRYMMFTDSMPKDFECYISHYPNGRGERYKLHPAQVSNFWDNLPKLPTKGNSVIFKRWDQLEDRDEPDAVIFFATPDVLSGLFTLTCFDSIAEDAVIAPFGAGCINIIYYPYREQIRGTARAVIGLMDPSARKCTKGDLVTFAIPITKFMAIIDQMEESFLATDTWKIIQSRIV